MSAVKERNDRLISLLPRIESQAERYVLRYRPDLDPAEIVQEACLSYLERANSDPTFLNQPDEEIARRVAMDGWNAARRVTMDGWNAARRRRKSWQDGRQVSLEPGGSRVFLNTLAADVPDPEEEAVKADLAERVHGVIAGLKPNYQEICRRLMGGSTKKAALEAVGAKQQAWPHYRRHLRHAFASMALL